MKRIGMEAARARAAAALVVGVLGFAIDWIKQYRAALVKAGGRGATSFTNINALSCAMGASRGLVEVPPGTTGNPYAKENCTSSLAKPTNDVEALTNGFVAITVLPAT